MGRRATTSAKTTPRRKPSVGRPTRASGKPGKSAAPQTAAVPGSSGAALELFEEIGDYDIPQLLHKLRTAAGRAELLAAVTLKHFRSGATMAGTQVKALAEVVKVVALFAEQDEQLTLLEEQAADRADTRRREELRTGGRVTRTDEVPPFTVGAPH